MRRHYARALTPRLDPIVCNEEAAAGIQVLIIPVRVRLIHKSRDTVTQINTSGIDSSVVVIVMSNLQVVPRWTRLKTEDDAGI